MNDLHGFDFYLIGKKRNVRVQVKTSVSRVKNENSYYYRVRSSGYKKDSRKEKGYDICAIYVPDCETWFIIPAKKLKTKFVSVFPHVAKSKSRLYKFKDAWEIIDALLR